MTYLRQFLILLAVSFLGEACAALLPLPIPAGIYGLGLMLLALETGAVKVERVKRTAGFLIDILPVTLVPRAASLMEDWGVLRPVLVPAAVLVVVTTALVMGVTGRTAQAIRKKGGRANG